MYAPNADRVLTLAGAIGFRHAACLNADRLHPDPAVRALCEDDRCSRYNRSWSCPPACGTIESAARRMADYQSAVVVQTTGQLTDSLDMDGIRRVSAAHTKAFDTLVRQTRLLGLQSMAMGAGCCTRCRACTYPDAPCRYPDRLYPSMEACGLLVRTVCEDTGLRYTYGENTITFISCILLKEEQNHEQP